MCSATQCGFRVWRLKEEVNDVAVRRSATGPGKPYWKRPLGSTRAFDGVVTGIAAGIGTGTGPVAVRVAETVVEAGEETVVVVMDVVGGSFSLREEKRAAVAAAPVAAPAAATMAKVTLDMPAEGVGIQAGMLRVGL